MSVAQCRAINAALRARGIVVHEWPGWETRSNGSTSAYVGGIVHHTGSAYGSAYQGLISGRTDLAGPLCNYAGNADGSITVMSAGPANHAGASGGRSMGPLPVTSSFNKYVLGLEIVYPGSQPMTAAQYRSATIWGAVVAQVVGGSNVQRIRAHAETSVTGKWDPGFAPGQTIDMNRFRADAAAQLVAPSQGEDLSYEPADATRDWSTAYRVRFLLEGAETINEGPLNGMAVPLNRTINAMARAITVLTQKVDALTAAIAASPQIPGGTVDVAALVDAVNDEDDRRDRDGDPSTGAVS